MNRTLAFVLLVVVVAVLGGRRGLAARKGSAAPHSRVVKLEILKRTPAFGGTAFGAVGPYEFLVARASAVVDPTAAANATIVDLDKAPRRRDGLVEYTFDVQILKPVDIAKGNAAMLYEFNNRGARLVYQYFNDKDLGYGAGDIGNGYV